MVYVERYTVYLCTVYTVNLISILGTSFFDVIALIIIMLSRGLKPKIKKTKLLTRHF